MLLAIAAAIVLAETTCKPIDPLDNTAGFRCDTPEAPSETTPKTVEECANSTKWDSFREGGCSIAQIRAAKQIVAQRQTVANYLRNSDCPDAYSAALGSADFELAAKVVSLCKALGKNLEPGDGPVSPGEPGYDEVNRAFKAQHPQP